ncbi:MAG: hypothetical protein KA310_03580 [Pseudomonadales bacterium]|nr:hypothetical protein [Pseudomonadales bacterium]
MSDTRCKHDRIVVSRTCETFRCYECKPLTHDDARAVVDGVRALYECIDAFFDEGLIDLDHEEGCPEDDTCECAAPAQFNDAMAKAMAGVRAVEPK